MEQCQLLLKSLGAGDVSTVMTAMAGMGMIFFIVMAFLFLLFLAIEIFIIVYLYSVLKRVPSEFRKMEPGLVFLLLIPCFSTVWMFFVYLRISESLKAYFDSKNNQTVGDCGKQIGLWAAILTAASILQFVPPVGQLAPLAGLVLLIIYLVKLNDLKKLITD
jgi:hypothetical protein